MKFPLQVLQIAKIEADFFWRYPKLLLATAVIIAVPALYALIYLSSIWDPASHTDALAVGVVNLDQGTVYRGKHFDLGAEITNGLLTQKHFGYQLLTDEQAARQMVRKGQLAFALIIPRNFSATTVPGVRAGEGKPIIFISEGNNYETGVIARHFAETLDHQVNEHLNEARWALVLEVTSNAQDQVRQLHAGVTQLRQGAEQLSQGAARTAEGARQLTDGNKQLSSGVRQLTDGMKQLNSGLTTLQNYLPPETELNRLKTGAEALAVGQNQMMQGIGELKSGTKRLDNGITAFRDSAKDSFFVPSAVIQGTDQLAEGISRLDNGLGSAWDAQLQLAAGATKLSHGVGALTDGMSAMEAGVQNAATKLPHDSQLNVLATGAGDLVSGSSRLYTATSQVAAGSRHLADGIGQLERALPPSVKPLEGTAGGLANSVEPQLDIVAPVSNSGSGLAPNIIPGALWLGAGVAAFLLHIRILPRQVQAFSAPARFFGKAFIPCCLVTLQALLLLLLVRFGLHIQVVHPAAFTATLFASAISFLLMVFSLSRAFGDAGKGFAMILLAVQFASSGGILPVELSGGLFIHISPWLPMTWAVKAVRATMFGAFESEWLPEVVILLAAGLLSSIIGCYVGRWHFTHPKSVRPAVDF